MGEKIFRIISNSDEMLNSETIALALLRQVSMSTVSPPALFGVQEVNDEEEKEKLTRNKE